MLFFIRIFVAFYICNTLQGYTDFLYCQVFLYRNLQIIFMKDYKIHINQRVIECINFIGNTEKMYQISEKLGISKQKLSEITSGRMAAGLDVIQNLCINYNINTDWLITGRGEMLLQEQQQEKQQKTPPPVADDTQLQRLQDLLEAKQETISVLQETNNNLLSEIQQLRNYVNVTSTKYIQMVEQTLAAATDTRSDIREMKVGFNAYHQSLAPSKHKITSHHTPKTK